jgi:membrane fusion protein (multidrug efflux system)
MRQHRTALSLICTAVAVCVIYTGYQVLSSSDIQHTDDAYVRADSVLIAPRVAGQITKVVVEDNQPVKAGDLLAQLDDRDFLVAQAAAAANVLAAKAQLQPR